MSTGIEWTDTTWNPVTGCDRVSPGCDHCYALTMAKRLKAMGNPRYQTDGDPRTSGPGFGVAMHPDVIDKPLRWRKPRRVFVNSMSDLFHPKVTDEFIARVFAVMGLARRHTFQVLTKRPKRMRSLLRSDAFRFAVDAAAIDIIVATDWARFPWPLPNVWLGTSVEDQQRANERIPALLDTPAAVRFLSCEPLLGPVDLCRCIDPNERCPLGVEGGIGWVIVGGESGPGARSMDLNWARSLVDQCTDVDVPVFVKQLGSKPTYYGDRIRQDHGKGGDPGQWPSFLRRREFPAEVPA